MTSFSELLKLFSVSTIQLLFLLFGLGHQVYAVIAPTHNPSLMIVGDSISQGRDSDFTWRYRLWDWSNSNGVSFNFVGPYTGTVQQASVEPPTPPPLYGTTITSGDDAVGAVSNGGGYNADSQWYGSSTGHNHFAAWGRQLAQDQGLIESMVAKYLPDYLLVELGFNDVGWFVSDAAGTLQSMISFINNARAAKPDIAFAIANIPQRTFIAGRDDLITKTDDYNAALPILLSEMFTDESPIYLVQFRENYDCNPLGCPAGYDGLHPNALGEFQIAKAFADTLSQGYGWPGNIFTIPSNGPVRACATPSNVVATASTCGVTVSWDAVPGAYGYTVHNGFAVGGVSEALSPVGVSAPSYTTSWTVAGVTWNYQVSASCSNIVSGMSDEVSATANPTCAPGPSNIIATSTADGIDFTWDAVVGFDVTEYGVIYWDPSTMAYLSDVGYSGTSASATGMNPGDRVITAIETWATVDGILCAGLPATGPGIVVGGVMPGAPTGLQAFTIGNGATVQLTWDVDNNAYSYGVYTRSLLDAASTYSLESYGADVSCFEATYLIPGAWNFEFCVVAYNGNYTSEMSECVVPPSSIVTVAPCPTLAISTAVGDPNPSATWSNPTPTSIKPSTSGGGGSASSSSIVYIDPQIWSSATPTVFCEPPCTFVLPPWTLSTLTTIEFPVVTETIEETWPETTGGVVEYITSTTLILITLGPITTSLIDVSNVVVSSSTSGLDLIYITSSIVPLPVTLTEASHGITWTYSPRPFPTGINIGPLPGPNPLSIHFSIGLPGPICLNILFGCGKTSPPGVDTGSDTSGCIGPGCTGGDNECVGEGCDEDDNQTTTKTTSTSDCTASSVTDYWVSCSQNSCTTTSSAVITGCSVTGTATTTDASCPATMSIDLVNNDQGDDGGKSPTEVGTMISVAIIPESVQIGQTPYPVMGGFVNIGGIAYSIPVVTAPVQTSLGTQGVTLFPGYIGESYSVTVPYLTPDIATQPPVTSTYGVTPLPSPTPTPTPTPTTAYPYPTNTAINIGGALCYSDYNSDGEYASFDGDDAHSAVLAMCNANYILSPGNTFGYVENYNGVEASISWADDQTGCGTEQDYAVSEDGCLYAWDTDFAECNGGSKTDNYGGGYVYNGYPEDTGGCILLTLSKYSSSKGSVVSNALLAKLNTTAASNQSTARNPWRFATSGDINSQHLFDNSTSPNTTGSSA